MGTPHIPIEVIWSDVLMALIRAQLGFRIQVRAECDNMKVVKVVSSGLTDIGIASGGSTMFLGTDLVSSGLTDVIVSMVGASSTNLLVIAIFSDLSCSLLFFPSYSGLFSFL